MERQRKLFTILLYAIAVVVGIYFLARGSSDLQKENLTEEVMVTPDIWTQAAIDAYYKTEET